MRGGVAVEKFQSGKWVGWTTYECHCTLVGIS